MRRVLVLLLLLIVALASLAGGCTDGPAGPGPADNGSPTDNVPSEPGPEFPGGMFGAVFDDANANGLRDAGEPGIKGVLVSNGVACRPTDGDGRYNLPSDNSLVFVTVPGDRTSTGAWYAVPSTDSINFGLRQTPGKGAAAGDAFGFTFIQVTDLHASQMQADELAALAADINALSPAFVMATGDLINEGNTATTATAAAWFDVYQDFAGSLQMPVYQAQGNHDVVGIHRSDVPAADPGYGKGLFVSRFGPTYYSFDWGRYHCIVLDPNDMEGGKQVYRIPQAQMQWLADDLSWRGEAPLLVFFHEPTVSWTNRAAVLDLLQGRSATLFCGHLHQGVTLDSGGFPEHITPAVCGEWWQGPNPDGRPQGYRLVSVRGDGVDSLYMGTGVSRTVDFGLQPVVSGTVDLAIKLHSRSGSGGSSAGTVTLQIDDDQTQTLALSLEDRGPWWVASGSWDTAPLAEGYHHLTLVGTDAAGTFEERFDFKKSAAGTVSVSDLTAHREVFHGGYVAVEAQLGMMVLGPISVGRLNVPEGVGLLLLRDGGDVLMVVAGEVVSPPLTEAWRRAGPGSRVTVKVAPLRLSVIRIVGGAEWAAYYPLLSTYLGQIPASAVEPPGAVSIDDMTAVWGARWLTADDLNLGPA